MGYRKTAETMTRERKSIAAAVIKAILMKSNHMTSGLGQ